MTDLAKYARDGLRGEAVYKGYRPRASLLERVAHDMPEAHVVVVSGSWCGDCRREVPKLARIMELLPTTWTSELHGDDDEARERYDVMAIPTFVVLDRPNGRELGRIIESPRGSDGIEGELLEIATGARLARA
jgi:thiol-disulfide isomerase/thioredoxin